MEAKAYQVEKYMEFGIKENEYIEKLSFEVIHPNIFYGVEDQNFKIIKENDFDNYNIIFRLITIQNKWYIFRALKTNKNEKVDFEEETRVTAQHIVTLL